MRATPADLADFIEEKRATVGQFEPPHPSHKIVECRWFSAAELEQVTLKPTNTELLTREGFLAAKCSRLQSE